jgi:hypothetical protein
MAAAGPLTNQAGARTVWAIAGGLFAGAAVVGFLMLRGVEQRVGAPAAERARPVEESAPV